MPFSVGPILDLNGKAVLLAPGPNGDKTIHLWRSDGTAQGTEDVETFRTRRSTTTTYTRGGTWCAAPGGLVYFAGAPTPATGTEPVRTDGTEAGTFVVKDLNTNTLSSEPSQTVYLGGGKVGLHRDGAGARQGAVGHQRHRRRHPAPEGHLSRLATAASAACRSCSAPC